jgi:type IV pilus assembly protein PilC
MATFKYKALDNNNNTIRGELLAANEIDLEDRLEGLGQMLLSAREVKSRSYGLMGSVKTKDLIILCIQLQQLEKAGVPLLEALSDVRDSTDSPKLRNIMTDVYESVKNGDVLSQALEKHPRIFSKVFIGLVRAGEKTGNLSDSFMQLAEHLKWNNDLRRKVKKAVSYPIVLTVVITGVISILMLFVVPKLIDFIKNQGFDIPPHTRALIAFSDFFSQYWYFVIGAPIVLGIVGAALYRTNFRFAYNVDKLMLKVPVIGSTVKKIDLARFTQFFGVMFKSGIDILEAFGTAQDVVKNRVLKEAIGVLRQSVSDGNSITSSMRTSGHFPNLVVRMFKVGEDSGNMNESLENVNFFYDREVNDAVDAMIGLIQPVLTVVLGGMILWIVAGVFGPLYDTFGKMKF